MKVWEDVRAQLLELQDTNGDPLFPEGINAITTIRRRVNKLLTWVKKRRDTAAVRSGSDDEVHSEFICLLENLLEQKESSDEKSAEEVAETSKQNKRKSSEAECLHLAAMNTAAGKKTVPSMKPQMLSNNPHLS